MQITTMEKFPLNWRWTDKKYCLLSEDEIAQIRPFSPSSAKELWKKSLKLIDSSKEFSPSPELFESIEVIDSNDTDKVTVWLKDKMPSESIFVSWQPDTAVMTNTDLFIKYWDEFCYPSSDDVTIWPENEAWVINYWHYEKLCYGKSRNV